MFVIYLYNTKGKVLTQIDDIIKVSNIHLKLNDISSAEVELYHDNPYCKREFLQEMRAIKVVKLVGNEEKIVIDGIIRGIETSIEKVKIIINDYCFLLDRRISFTKKKYSSTSVRNIVSSLLNETNQRFDTNILPDCDSDKINLEIRQGETILSALKKISKLGFDFQIKNKKLLVKKITGKERSGGKDFLEYRYDYINPEEINIDSISAKQESKNIINGVGISSTGATVSYYMDDESISKFGLNEQTFPKSNNNGPALLEEHKNSNIEFSIKTKSQNFYEAGLGDVVKVYINMGNDILYVDSTMKIAEINRDGEQGVKYSLAKKSIKTLNIIEQIKELKNKVSIMEL